MKKLFGKKDKHTPLSAETAEKEMNDMMVCIFWIMFVQDNYLRVDFKDQLGLDEREKFKTMYVDF